MPDTQPFINACDWPPTHLATSGEPETPLWGMPPTPRGCRGRGGGGGSREGGRRRSCLLNLCPIDSVYKQRWGRWGTVTLGTADPPRTPSRGPREPPGLSVEGARQVLPPPQAPGSPASAQTPGGTCFLALRSIYILIKSGFKPPGRLA